MGIFDNLFSRDVLADPGRAARGQPAPAFQAPMPIAPPMLGELIKPPKAQPDEMASLFKQAMGLVKDNFQADEASKVRREREGRPPVPQETLQDYYATLNQNDSPGDGPRQFNPLEMPEGSSGDLGSFDSSSVPGAYLKKTRAFESGNNSRAVNPGSGASGSYQFLPSTWKSLMEEAPHLGLTHEGILDDAEQEKAMHYFTAKNASALKKSLGVDATGGMLYAMHLLGQSGGQNVIANLDKPLSDTVDPRAMKGNPWLYNYKTGRDLLNALNKRFG